MVRLLLLGCLTLWIAVFQGEKALAQNAPGSIRGVIVDKEFGDLLAGVQVTILDLKGKTATSTNQGNYVLPDVPPGRYTVGFARQGYVRQIKTEVLVRSGELTDLDVRLAGDFTEMDEVIVEESVQLGGSTEAGLLKLRIDSPALLDSIGSELMSRAGASDAASALRLVSGATVSDGKFAVIRGLPDRYVSSQINGVRLPTADEDKRAVQLDQFPAPVIESLQVSKTFTPDQQGDASGGAVNIKLKSIPQENFVQFRMQTSYNSNVRNRRDFLSYRGGGVNTWGKDDSGRGIQWDNIGDNWDGAAGVQTTDAPEQYKWSTAVGVRQEFDEGFTIGGFASFFYERDASFFDDGVNNQLWVEEPGAPLTPKTIQGGTQDGDFKTQLFDVTQATELVQWGGLGTVGIETENNFLGATYLYTRTTEDTATLAEDTRGKEFFFPGYDPDDPRGPGNRPDERDTAPYIRTETLEYTEREADTFQLNGRHRLPVEDWEATSWLTVKAPELDWTYSKSTASLDQPDKRQFGSLFIPESFNPGLPFIIPPFSTPPTQFPFKPAANFNLGNFQRIFKSIEEESDQYFVNLKVPFEQWSEDEGYLKFGYFDDKVDREFDQETFSNFGDADANFEGDFGELWSEQFPFEDHPITAFNGDIDYDGDQDISAWYAMADLPIFDMLNIVGGFRVEKTDISIVNDPEEEATWFPPGSTAPVVLNPGDADVALDQEDVLPSIGFILRPFDNVTFRGAYSETVARPTFKELTPIIQQEFLGGPIFIGNPDLDLAELQNYDLRLDYTPYEGGLLSASWFYKDIKDPIETVQRVQPFDYTFPVNYPSGEITGFEFEARQSIGRFWDVLDGLALGANATFLDSSVRIPDNERAEFELPNIDAPMKTRDATGAPEHLYNLFMTYDSRLTGTQVSLFYTVTGDTLIAGAGTSAGNFVPNVYAKEFDTLNLSIAQRIGKYIKLQFQARNLTNPDIETKYRSGYVPGGEQLRTSFSRGVEYSVSLSAEIPF